MKCAHCHKDIVLEYKMKLLNVDGDFVCDDKCYAAYQREKDHFLNVILPDDAKFAAWLTA